MVEEGSTNSNTQNGGESMIKALRQKGTKGFTLIELLVVIAIIGILAALLFPAISKALLSGQATALGNNGRGIQQMIFGADTGNQAMLASGMSVLQAYPVDDHDDYAATSTDYFIWAVRTNVLTNIDFTFFAGKDVTAVASLSDFEAKNNAWCIVANLSDDSPANTPFLFSRNVECTDIGDEPTLHETRAPFKDKLAVIVTKGGSVKIIPSDLFSHDTFNPVHPITEERYSRPVLRPGPGF